MPDPGSELEPQRPEQASTPTNGSTTIYFDPFAEFGDLIWALDSSRPRLSRSSTRRGVINQSPELGAIHCCCLAQILQKPVGNNT